MVACPQADPAPPGLMSHVLFAALECSSLRLCRAEALVALGQYPQALEDLDAVCRAEPGQHEVSEGHMGCTGAASPSPAFSIGLVLLRNALCRATGLLIKVAGAVLLSQQRSGTVSILHSFSNSP